jgi:hypothetical protein
MGSSDSDEDCDGKILCRYVSKVSLLLTMSSGIIAAMEPFLLQTISFKIRDLQVLLEKFSDFVMEKAHDLG